MYNVASSTGSNVPSNVHFTDCVALFLFLIFSTDPEQVIATTFTSPCKAFPVFPPSFYFLSFPFTSLLFFSFLYSPFFFSLLDFFFPLSFSPPPPFFPLLLLQACGTPLESYDVLINPDKGDIEGLVLGVKDVSDMVNFDQQQVRQTQWSLSHVFFCLKEVTAQIDYCWQSRSVGGRKGRARRYRSSWSD